MWYFWCCYWFRDFDLLKTFIMDLVIMIMRTCIYLLFPLYLRNLVFPWILKILHNVTEAMVVLILLLFALKLVESGAHHTCGWGHDTACTPPPPTTFLNPLPNVLKRGWGLNGYQVLGGFAGKERVTFSRMGCNFYVKKKLKSENYKQKCFPMS